MSAPAVGQISAKYGTPAPYHALYCTLPPLLPWTARRSPQVSRNRWPCPGKPAPSPVALRGYAAAGGAFLVGCGWAWWAQSRACGRWARWARERGTGAPLLTGWAGMWHRGPVPPVDTSSTSPLPVDLVPLKEAARRVDRAPSTLRDWIRAGELRSFEGEGTHPRNRPTLVSVGELQALVVQTGKAAHPGRRPPVEEEEGAADLRVRLATSEGEIRALRVELDGERRAAAGLQTAIQVAAERDFCAESLAARIPWDTLGV